MTAPTCVPCTVGASVDGNSSGKWQPASPPVLAVCGSVEYCLASAAKSPPARVCATIEFARFSSLTEINDTHSWVKSCVWASKYACATEVLPHGC